jgi:aminoglycoside 2''-phosphotransferase
MNRFRMSRKCLMMTNGFSGSQPDRATMIASIARGTGLTIDTTRVLQHGAYNVIVEVNDEWVFRFPRRGSPRDNEQERLCFLESFAKVSPLPVPDPIYVTDDFVAYKRIGGSHLYPTQIARLPNAGKLRVAEQLGAFLGALHRHEDKSITFETGWTPTPGSDPSGDLCVFSPFLDATECRNFETNLRALHDNPANYVRPTAILHGDLYFGNMLWDKEARVVTGIIDWSSLGRGLPAWDFIGLADFATSRNDGFLKEILRWYGGDDALFNQIKEMTILEMMNWYWCYWHRKDQKGMTRAIKRMKRVLSRRR